MLTLPPSPYGDCYRIVGIDPGTDTLGAAALDLDLTNGRVRLLEARTFIGSQLAKEYPYVINSHGERVARLIAHEDNLYGYYSYMQPHSIISESPYMGRFPQAFAALTECLTAVRRSVMRYDLLMPLLLVDPPTAKKAVGAAGKGGTKDDVKQALLRLENLENVEGIDLTALDEHSIDAIAVAYSRAQQILGRL